MKAISLISGGFDSPIATYLMIKKGIDVYGLYLFIGNYEELKKIRKIAKKLISYGMKKMYVVDQREYQKQIVLNDPGGYTCVLCKRGMIRSALAIAKKKNIKYIITGENLSSKASQTLQNLADITEVAEKQGFVVLRPLVSFGKQEIIEISRKIGLYEICSKDTGKCQYLQKKVKTSVKQNILENIESKININKIVEIEEIV